MFWDISWRWEDMCGPAGLQPWDHVSKDVGLCFQELFLQIPLYFIIAVVSGYFVGYRRDWVVREKTQERAIVLRSFVVLALVFIPIIELYIFITKVDFVLYPIDYFVAAASCLSWLVHFGYVLALKHRLGPSARGPSLQLFLWSLTVVLNVIALRSGTLVGSPIAFYIATLCCHILYFITLIPSSDSRPTYYSTCLVGSQHAHNEYTPLLPHVDEGILGTAMQGNGCFSQLMFLWVNPLLKKGFDKKLNDPEELFDLPTKYRCGYVGAKMDRALIGNVDNYQQYMEIPHEPFISSGYGAVGAPGAATPVTPTARVPLRARRRVSLLRALHACFALQFYSIGVLKLVSDMAGFAGPLLLNKLVQFVEDETIDQHYGYLYAGGLLAAALAGALFGVHFTWLMALVGLRMRGAIVAAILAKTLAVTAPDLTAAFTVGEITNFMSTDTDRIVNSCPSFHALWSIPLQLVITLALLYQQVGVSCLAGVAFSVLLIPVNKVIADRIGALSRELMRHKDARVTLLSDMLRGIRAVKAHVWEDYFINRVTESRSAELRYLRWRKYLDAVCVVLWATTPVLVAALTLGAHALRGAPLTPATVFTTVALVNMLIAPLNAFPWVLNGLTEAWVSLKRIQKLLDLPDMDPESYYGKLNTNRNEDNIIIIQNATFAWAKPVEEPLPAKTDGGTNTLKKNVELSDSNEEDEPSEASELSEPFMLRDISLEIERGELLGVAGAVGSGKTSLLHAVMGDMLRKAGEIQIPESLNSFGYVSQKPWLIRGTIRENILFGKPYDETKFRAVIEACALTEELEQLGWHARVGDAGCTLSGGQRARLALARAVYQDQQVYLLDDIFSSVDARVAEHIMRRCVLGLLRRTTRLLCASSPRLLGRCSRTVLVRHGRITAQGPPSGVVGELGEPAAAPSHEAPAPPARDPDSLSLASVDDEEGMSEGAVGWRVLALYLRSAGWALSLAILLSLVLMQLSQNFTFVWLTFWVRSKPNATDDSFADHENTTALDHGFNAIDTVIDKLKNISNLFINNGNTAPRVELAVGDASDAIYASDTSDAFYLKVYFGLAALNLVFTVARAFLFAYGGVRAAAAIHRSLLNVVTKAKVKFFDVTPTGRILNRFSSDTYTVDDSLPFILNIFLAQVFGLIGAVAVAVSGLPWLLAGAAPAALVFYRLQRLYRVTSRQLKRLQSVTLSPIYAHFNDTLEGLSTIRALGASARWSERGAELVEAWQRTALAAAAAAQWLALRLQAAAGAMAAAAGLLAVLQRDTHALAPGVVGLAISYALSMTSMLGNVLGSFTETERELVAVERVGEYITQVECEETDGELPPYGWPSQGVVSFHDVHLDYRSGGRGAALCGVTFSSRPGEKLGVVGRTGAGKSSLLAALLRLAPAAGVRVDGVPVERLQLRALRSRIGMIPQEPFIFTGSVRENVDPLRQHSDADVWDALERCGASQALGPGGLTARADRLSRGLAQQLCVARAVLQRAKVVLIDEATAHLDPETERVVLEAIRRAFGASTVLLVAHRAASVLGCARVLVMGAGRVLELAAPAELLEDPASHLHALVHAHDRRSEARTDW